jgi:hypothetical protein
MRIPPPVHLLYASVRGLPAPSPPELSKIQTDAVCAESHFPDLQVLLFTTSGKATNETAEKWKEEIKKEYGWEDCRTDP